MEIYKRAAQKEITRKVIYANETEATVSDFDLMEDDDEGFFDPLDALLNFFPSESFFEDKLNFIF